MILFICLVKLKYTLKSSDLEKFDCLVINFINDRVLQFFQNNKEWNLAIHNMKNEYVLE